MEKTKLSVLKEVAVELNRFQKKLALAIKEQSNTDPYHGHNKHYAASKRSAMDLKNELTKLTQDSKYRWQSE